MDMFKTLIIIASLSFAVPAYSQDIPESEVPSAVKDNFYSKFKEKNVKWEKENGNYEAEYKENGMERSVILNSTGSVIAIETEIETSSLPSEVSNAINQNYPGAEIEEAELVDSNGNTNYEVELNYKGRSIDLFISPNGTISEQSDDSDEGEDDD
jgi:uncharacterized membrane protein YkoI